MITFPSPPISMLTTLERNDLCAKSFLNLRNYFGEKAKRPNKISSALNIEVRGEGGTLKTFWNKFSSQSSSSLFHPGFLLAKYFPSTVVWKPLPSDRESSEVYLECLADPRVLLRFDKSKSRYTFQMANHKLTTKYPPNIN